MDGDRHGLKSYPSILSVSHLPNTRDKTAFSFHKGLVDEQTWYVTFLCISVGLVVIEAKDCEEAPENIQCF